MILAVETIGPAAEADELVEIAVVVVVGPRVRLTAGHAKQVGLDQLESRSDVARRQRQCQCCDDGDQKQWLMVDGSWFMATPA